MRCLQTVELAQARGDISHCQWQWPIVTGSSFSYLFLLRVLSDPQIYLLTVELCLVLYILALSLMFDVWQMRITSLTLANLFFSRADDTSRW